MGLREYQRKRHFQRTAEPKGKRAATGGHAFVVQKHYASHRHYDFRLELAGVLKSWAVPKGPSLDPSVKRLAMQVEDHPVEYGKFEGIIPQGEYGGGTVLLWDRGQWTPLGNPDEDYRRGRLKFQLHGKKLRGGWMLVRTAGPRDDLDRRAGRHWLLFKENDAEAKPSAEVDILEEAPLSVATGRSIEQIAKGRSRVWSSKKHEPNGNTSKRSSKRAQPRSKALRGARNDYDATAETYAGERLTSPDKLLYPDQGITKLELASYYRSIAEWILPHIADRPLVLVRCPEGRRKACFYQKHPGPGTPANLRRIPIREEKKTEDYVIVDDAAGLISLAQIGALEIHAWGSRADRLEHPDRFIFDLDPDQSVGWDDVVLAARQVREFLQQLGLESFVKTTGGKGLHLVVPIERRHTWDDAKAFCKLVADSIVRADPAHYTANMSKAARKGKIFLDYLRNGRGATAIVPYSTRARDGAPVSTPLTWEEMSVRIRSDRFTVRNISRRLTSLRHDPWQDFGSVRQRLDGAIHALHDLNENQ